MCTHSLITTGQTDRPERRTMLIAEELSRYKIHIAALSKMRLAEEGQLVQVGVGYTLLDWTKLGC